MYMGAGTPTGKGTLENALQGMYLKKLTPEQVIADTQKVLDNPTTGAKK
jgi:raffinose/stachyose/melibiose transport system substrate-binding protein